MHLSIYLVEHTAGFNDPITTTTTTTATATTIWAVADVVVVVAFSIIVISVGIVNDIKADIVINATANKKIRV